MRQLSSVVEKSKDEIDNLQKTLAFLKAENRALSERAAEGEGRRELEKLQKAMGELEAENRALKEKAGEAATLSQKLLESGLKTELFQKNYDKVEKSLNEKNQLLSNAEFELREREAAIAKLRRQEAERSQRLRDLESECSAARAEVARLSAAMRRESAERREAEATQVAKLAEKLRGCLRGVSALHADSVQKLIEPVSQRVALLLPKLKKAHLSLQQVATEISGASSAQPEGEFSEGLRAYQASIAAFKDARGEDAVDRLQKMFGQFAMLCERQRCEGEVKPPSGLSGLQGLLRETLRTAADS